MLKYHLLEFDMEKKFTCIVCPQGCSIKVDGDLVSGNKCPRGEAYVREELSDPKRTVTAVVRTDSSNLHFIPVRTDKPISRKLVFNLLKSIYSLTAKVPLKSGDVIIENYENTGVNVKVTRTLEK